MRNQTITCNWLGHAQANGNAGTLHSLVVHPLAEVSPDTAGVLARSVGLTPLDVRIRLRSQGWFLLVRGPDLDAMNRAARDLGGAGIRTTVFHDSATFEVPAPAAANAVRVEGGGLAFLNTSQGPVLSLLPGHRVLIVTALATFESRGSKTQTVAAMSMGGLGATRTLRQTSRQEEKRAVSDIYNLSSGGCARILEPNFNFGDMAGGAPGVVAFRDGLRWLLATLRGAVRDTRTDARYKNSSLPFTLDEDHTKQSTGTNTFLGSVQRSRSDSSDLPRFDQYSRFRYIVETLPGALP